MNVIILCGISGSGKSTWAKEFMAANPSYVCINRDALRLAVVKQLDGYYQRPDLNKFELIVNACTDAIMAVARQHNSNVLVDNTNLTWKYIEPFITHHGVTSWQYKLFNTHPTVAKVRVLQRDFADAEAVPNVEGDLDLDYNKVAYIDRQYTQLQAIKKYLLDNHLDNQYKNA